MIGKHDMIAQQHARQDLYRCEHGKGHSCTSPRLCEPESPRSFVRAAINSDPQSQRFLSSCYSHNANGFNKCTPSRDRLVWYTYLSAYKITPAAKLLLLKIQGQPDRW